MGTKATKVIGGATDPDERIRIEWGQNLAEAMAAQDLMVKGLAKKLDDEFEIKVSRQAVESWLAGKYAPRPYVQGAIGAILGIPARVLFPISTPARTAA